MFGPFIQAMLDAIDVRFSACEICSTIFSFWDNLSYSWQKVIKISWKYKIWQDFVLFLYIKLLQI